MRPPRPGPDSTEERAGPSGRLEEALARLYGVALWLLPSRFRRLHGRDMKEVALRRLRERRRRGACAALIHGLLEGGDLGRVALRLRLRNVAGRLPVRDRGKSGGWSSPGPRVAAASALAAALVTLAVDVRIEVPRLFPGTQPGAGGVGADSLEFRARDPAGEFTLSIRRGRVVAATVDGRPVPDRRVVQVGDSIRVLATGGGRVVAVHFDPEAGRIRWDGRSGAGGERAAGDRDGASAAARPSREPPVPREGGSPPEARLPQEAEPPAATAETVARVSEALRRLGPELGPSIWPGFRPDTIPVRFVLSDLGALLANWGRALPEGYRRLEGTGLGWRPDGEPGAASTGGELGGRAIAQVVVRDSEFAELLGVAVHEAFHVFSWSRREEGRWFGTRENSFLVTSYPVFDVANEREVILEGRLLREALATDSDGERRRIVEEFLAVREARHRRLGHELAHFEAAGEMNEGLAEYALIRAGQAANRTIRGTPSFRRLENLSGDADRSIRLRFYSTGLAMALLLDRIDAPEWKTRLVLEENLDLQEALARAVGYRERERRLREVAVERHDGGRLSRLAAARVDPLRRTRLERAEEIRSAPGLLVVVSMAKAGRSIGLCSFDPQNLLQGPEGLLLHTRWLRPCAGSALSGEVSTPAVQDRRSGTLAAVAGPEAEVRVTVGGDELALADGEERLAAEGVVVESPRLTLRSARADLRRRGRRLELIPHPD